MPTIKVLSLLIIGGYIMENPGPLKSQLHALKWRTGKDTHSKVTNSQSEIKICDLPKGLESHYKTKSVAFGSRATKSSESSSIPKE